MVKSDLFRTLESATIVLNESGEVLSFRTFGGVTDETLQNITVVGRNLAKRVFYLINHKLLA